MEHPQLDRRTRLLREANKAPNAMWFTPAFAVDYILPHLGPFPRIWECCAGEGHIVRCLEARGHVVHGTDISAGPEYDVHTYAPPLDSFDCVVTNPPFPGKTALLKRLFELDKPFAVLVPTNVLESKPIRNMLKEHAGRWGMLLPPLTINYIPAAPRDTRSRSFFHSSWLCYRVPGVVGVQLL